MDIEGQFTPETEAAVRERYEALGPTAQTVVAATFQDERDAAVETLRRQAFGRVYREVV